MIAGLLLSMKYLLFLSAIIGLSVFATELSKEYIYNPSTDDAFIDDAFPAERKEYQASITRWDTVQLVNYDDMGNKRIVKTIRKQQVNPEPVQPLVEQPTLELKETTEHKETYLKKFSDDAIAQTYIKYAREISKDKDFILTMNAENWARELMRQSWAVGKNWYRDIWLCQINKWRHKKIVNDPRFTDYKRQIEQCWRLYQWWTRFYWFDVRYKRSKWNVVIDWVHY